MNIEWISVSPGKVFIGSDNRSILFGGVGPRHEVKIDYDYEISYLPIDIEVAQEIIQSEDCFIASESEWTLAMENKLISGENEVEEFYEALSSIYKDRVDVILCETMASIFEGNIAAKVATKNFDKVWLSWNTRGLDPAILPSGDALIEAAKTVAKYPLDCQLINCSHADLITQSLEIIKSCAPSIGVYANSSIYNAENSTLESYENIAEVHYHHAKDITPEEYADFAKKWIAMGCKVIGGCCTTTPEHIKLIADLRN